MLQGWSTLVLTKRCGLGLCICILIACAKNDALILIQNTVVGYGKPALLPTPTKAGIATATLGQLAPSQVLPSSTTQPGHHNRAQADSSKKEKVSSSIPESVLFYDSFFFFFFEGI